MRSKSSINQIDVLVSDISAANNRHVFGITGSGPSLTLADGLERNGVTFVRTHFEGAAGIMAATVGRLTGRAGVAVCIKGPGLSNMVPGLAVASFESFPMVAICEAYPKDAPLAKAHKRMDHDLLTGAVTKSRRPLSGDGSGYSHSALFAETEVPGPVVLELSGDKDVPPEDNKPPKIKARDTSSFMRVLECAKRPVIIAGSLAVRRGWGDALSEMHIPVFSTVSAKGIIDEEAPYAAGVYTGVGLELTPEYFLLSEADLVIGLGLRPAELLDTKPFSCPSINIEADQDVPGVDAFKFQSMANLVDANSMFEILQAKNWGLDLVEAVVSKLRLRLFDGPFLPAHVFKLLEDTLDRKARIVMDTGYFCTIGEHALRISRADLCLMSAQGRYMGTSLPMAIGAAIHDPSLSTVVVMGDGGIGPFVGELRIAIERKLPLLVILMTDGRFGSVSTRAIRDNMKSSLYTMGEPSWAAILDGFGLRSYCVSDEVGFLSSLKDWSADKSPTYIEVSFEPVAYEQMVQGIR